MNAVASACARSVQYSGDNEDRRHHTGNIIWKHRLGADRGGGAAGMIPQISEARERSNVHPERREMAFWTGSPEPRHAQIDDVRVDLAKLLVSQADALDHINAVIVQYGIYFSDQIMQDLLTARVFQIDCE